MLFTRAYTPNAKCAPSRAILLTARHSWRLEEAANHVPFFPTKFKTWAEALGEHGYVTGATGKGWGPGVANDAQGKPWQMTGRPFNHHKSAAPMRQISENDYAANFADFLSTVPPGRPWSFKTKILQRRRDGRDTRAWTLAFGRRPGEELYDLKQDPFCLINLADDRRHRARLERLRQQLARELRAQNDPRMFGRGYLFDRYIYADESTRNFYERFMRGEKITAGWVNASDFETSPIK